MMDREEMQRLREKQAAYVRDLAARVHPGMDIDERAAGYIAGGLQLLAEALEAPMPRRPGREKQFDRFDAALVYAWKRVHDGLSKTRSIEETAEFFDVSTKAMADALPGEDITALALVSGLSVDVIQRTLTDRGERGLTQLLRSNGSN